MGFLIFLIFFYQFLVPVIFIFAYFTILYLIGEKSKNYSIVDIGWGAGFVLVAIVAAIIQFLLKATLSSTAIVVVILTAIWGVRLSSHIYRRNHGKPEDFRYVAMRERYAKMKFPRLAAYARIFLTQAVFMTLISIVILLAVSQAPLTNAFWHYGILGFGAFLWIVGFLFESVGDTQLAAFIKNPDNRGKIMDRGLWRYTRHPNYFGESLMWIGVGVATISVNFGYIGLISPLVITWLLVFVSGVPLLEKEMMKRPGFAEYASKTPIFFPWFPKK